MENYILGNSAGSNFDSVSKKAYEIACSLKRIVEFEFNGRKCLVSSTTVLENLWRDYSNSWTMDWRTIGPDCADNYSPEVAEELRNRLIAQEKQHDEDCKKQQAKDELEKVAFVKKVEGIEIELSDSESWKIYKEKNTDPYGACCVEYAEGWAKLMQVEIASGKSVKDCAEKTSFQLGFLGITGFMYGAAVSMLAKCWKHGEELRKWHNKEYKHEGEGVVNPAILTIG